MARDGLQRRWMSQGKIARQGQRREDGRQGKERHRAARDARADAVDQGMPRDEHPGHQGQQDGLAVTHPVSAPHQAQADEAKADHRHGQRLSPRKRHAHGRHRDARHDQGRHPSRNGIDLRQIADPVGVHQKDLVAEAQQDADLQLRQAVKRRQRKDHMAQQRRGDMTQSDGPHARGLVAADLDQSVPACVQGGRGQNRQKDIWCHRNRVTAPGDHDSRAAAPTSSTGRPKTFRIEIRTGVSAPSSRTS